MHPCNKILARDRCIKICFDIIFGIAHANRPAAVRSVAKASVVVIDAPVLAGHILRPYENDNNANRRLMTLVWLWANPDVDYPAFMRCDDEVAAIGTYAYVDI